MKKETIEEKGTPIEYGHIGLAAAVFVWVFGLVTLILWMAGAVEFFPGTTNGATCLSAWNVGSTSAMSGIDCDGRFYVPYRG